MTTTPPTLESLEARIAALETTPTNPIRGLLTSKKAIVSLGTVISMATGKLGFHLDDDTTQMLAATGISLILAIGMQDLGKEKARIEQ